MSNSSAQKPGGTSTHSKAIRPEVNDGRHQTSGNKPVIFLLCFLRLVITSNGNANVMEACCYRMLFCGSQGSNFQRREQKKPQSHTVSSTSGTADKTPASLTGYVMYTLCSVLDYMYITFEVNIKATCYPGNKALSVDQS